MYADGKIQCGKMLEDWTLQNGQVFPVALTRLRAQVAQNQKYLTET